MLPPATNFDRLNAAIDQARIVPDLDSRIAALLRAVETLGSRVDDGQIELLAFRSATSATLSEAASRSELNTIAIAVAASRPGETPDLFSTVATGSGKLNPGLDGEACASTPLGRCYRLDGAGLIAPRSTIAVDPDAIWIVRMRYWRVADVFDPNNNAVDLGIQWLDTSDGDAGNVLVRRESNLRVQDGPRTLTCRVPSLTGATPTIMPPEAAVSWRPYLRTYGADGATGLEMLGTSEATFAGVYAPDVAALAGRLRTLEGQIASGFALQTRALLLEMFARLPADRSLVAIGEPYRAGEMIAFRLD